MSPNTAKIFYVIGASGSGKDSLIQYARQHLPETTDVAFAHRYITRPADAGGENHVELNEAEFETRLKHHCFSMHWHSHGLLYGIGHEIEDWVNRGINVVVNGSREYFAKASWDFPQLVPVLIRVDTSVLEERLRARGRESEADIKRRLKRAEELDGKIHHDNLIVINNDGALEDAGNELLSVLCDTKGV